MLHLLFFAQIIFAIMNILQVNIQSLNTSATLLKSAISRHDIDLVLLQEVWYPKKGFSVPDFHRPLFNLRDDHYGGVGILARNNLRLCKDLNTLFQAYRQFGLKYASRAAIRDVYSDLSTSMMVM